MEDNKAIFIFTDGTKEQDEVKCYVKKEDLLKEALKYRNKRKQLLRQNQYRDLYIKVYI